MNAPPGPIGVVAGHEIPGALLDARLAELRSGPAADLLPPPDCLEGRRLRRWVAQLVLTEELVRAEADRLGVPDPGDLPGDDQGSGIADTTADGAGGGRRNGTGGDLGDHTGRPGAPDDLGPPPHGLAGLALWPAGSLASAVLAVMPLARAVYRMVTAGVRVDDDQARAFYQRNPELWTHPERRTLLHAVSGQPPDPGRLHEDGTWLTCTREELPEALALPAFSAAPGALVGPVNTPFGWQICLVGGVTPARVDSFATVRDQIAGRLTRSKRDRYFERWIEQRRSELVAVAVGCEHPGDPRHSDYTHHH